ncbi:TPA: tetratricopeptide repeat protein [Candidatus Poribacteria bacterium]|nr:tetratricopeptide repeat protein [Candidatus Poribacteria bacterium]
MGRRGNLTIMFMLLLMCAIWIGEFVLAAELDSSEKVIVVGAVREPGTYRMKRPMTVLDILAIAGGVTEAADLKRVAIVSADGKDLKEIDLTKHNIKLSPGYTIFVRQKQLQFDDAHEIPEPEKLTEMKLTEELNLSGETLAELVGENPRLSGLREITAKVYELLDFEWDSDKIGSILEFYYDNLKTQGWRVMLRKIVENKATLNLILQKDGSRKGLFIVQLTPKELTLIKLIGKFNLGALDELRSALQAKWQLDTLRPFQRASKFRLPEVGVRTWEIPSDLSKIRVEKELEEYRRRLEAEIQKTKAEVAKAEVEAYIHQGVEYEREGNYVEALAQYQKILHEFPDASDWYIIRSIYGLAYNYELLGNLNGAKKRYEELIDRVGGRSYFVPAAEAALKRIADGEPAQPVSNEEARILLAQAESSIYNDYDYRKAIRDYQTLIDKYPSTIYAASAQLMMGMCYGWLFEPQKQIQTFQKAAENYPNASVHYYLASAYQRQGRFKEALEQYKALLQNYPDTYYWQRLLAEYNIAQCLGNLQRFDEAIEQYDKFLAQYGEATEFKELVASARIAFEKLKRGVNLPFLGVGLRRLGDRVVVTRVISGSAAEMSGIQKAMPSSLLMKTLSPRPKAL